MKDDINIFLFGISLMLPKVRYESRKVLMYKMIINDPSL